jgi:hypothetical protein
MQALLRAIACHDIILLQIYACHKNTRATIPLIPYMQRICITCSSLVIRSCRPAITVALSCKSFLEAGRGHWPERRELLLTLITKLNKK